MMSWPLYWRYDYGTDDSSYEESVGLDEGYRQRDDDDVYEEDPYNEVTATNPTFIPWTAWDDIDGIQIPPGGGVNAFFNGTAEYRWSNNRNPAGDFQKFVIPYVENKATNPQFTISWTITVPAYANPWQMTFRAWSDRNFTTLLASQTLTMGDVAGNKVITLTGAIPFGVGEPPFPTDWWLIFIDAVFTGPTPAITSPQNWPTVSFSHKFYDNFTLTRVTAEDSYVSNLSNPGNDPTFQALGQLDLVGGQNDGYLFRVPKHRNNSGQLLPNPYIGWRSELRLISGASPPFAQLYDAQGTAFGNQFREATLYLFDDRLHSQDDDYWYVAVVRISGTFLSLAGFYYYAPVP